MELSQIGAHCFLSTCKELDFLPLQCDGCLHYFCRHHVIPDTHQCVQNLPDPNVKSQTLESLAVPKIKKCNVENCKHPSLDGCDSFESSSNVCQRCGGSYCAYHRYPESHSCNVEKSDPTALLTCKTQAARALLQHNFSSTKNNLSIPSTNTSSRLRRRPGGNPPSDPTRLAQYRKVEAIKMRHRASPGDPKDNSASVPLEERMHVKVSVGESEKILWFRKTLIAGRVLDLLAALMNVPSATQLVYLKDDQRISIRNDYILADQVEDGCTLLLI